eukprot:2848511-Rhodomonas_salina.1
MCVSTRNRLGALGRWTLEDRSIEDERGGICTGNGDGRPWTLEDRSVATEEALESAEDSSLRTIRSLSTAHAEDTSTIR